MYVCVAGGGGERRDDEDGKTRGRGWVTSDKSIM